MVIIVVGGGGGGGRVDLAFATRSDKILRLLSNKSVQLFIQYFLFVFTINLHSSFNQILRSKFLSFNWFKFQGRNSFY